MKNKKLEKVCTSLVSDSFGNAQEGGNYEVAFLRLVVREIEEGKMTTSEAVERFHFNPPKGRHLIHDWRKKYATEMVLSLPVMS